MVCAVDHHYGAPLRLLLVAQHDVGQRGVSFTDRNFFTGEKKFGRNAAESGKPRPAHEKLVCAFFQLHRQVEPAVGVDVAGTKLAGNLHHAVAGQAQQRHFLLIRIAGQVEVAVGERAAPEFIFVCGFNGLPGYCLPFLIDKEGLPLGGFFQTAAVELIGELIGVKGLPTVLMALLHHQPFREPIRLLRLGANRRGPEEGEGEN